MSEDVEFKNGDLIYVHNLLYEYKGYPWLEVGLIGTVVDCNLKTVNKSGYQRLEIDFYLGSEIKKAKLYSGEVELIKTFELSGEELKVALENVNKNFKGENNMVSTNNGKIENLIYVVGKKVEGKLSNEVESKKKELIKADKIGAEKDKFLKKVSEILNIPEEGLEISVKSNNIVFMLTEETQTKIEELNKEFNRKKKELDNKLCEVSALLDLCGNFDEMCTVLANYGIMNQDFSLNDDFEIK